MRFYGGVQLYSAERAKLGTLCVLDNEPREFNAAELDEPHDLARMVEELIYHRQLAIAAQQLHAQLQQHALGAQLAAAAGQVEFLLTHDTLSGLAIMHRLRALGVTLSIDDFGTGYSSFSYLKRLPIDKLKIDKSFAHDMVHSADARAIVLAIVAMAHRMNLRVVADGVESKAQGYFHARPLDAAGAIGYLAPAPGQELRRQSG